MLLTEEEVREKWCPHTRRLEGGWNGTTMHPAATSNLPRAGNSCIASQCSQWRWHPHLGSKDPDPPKGYCGLAGRPFLQGLTGATS